MLILSRDVDTYVDCLDQRGGPDHRVRLVDLTEGVAEVKVTNLKTGELLNVWRLKLGDSFEVGELSVHLLRLNSARQARMGFEAPRHISIQRDNIKQSRPGRMAA